MATKETWLTVRLFDLSGKRIGAARVPQTPLPPVVIIWANRHFMLTAPKADYQEVRAHLVPLENMYAGDVPPPSGAGEHGQ